MTTEQVMSKIDKAKKKIEDLWENTNFELVSHDEVRDKVYYIQADLGFELTNEIE